MTRKGELIEFVVSDDGPGIPTTLHEKAFGMFQTLKRRDEVEGSGMGLALVKKTVETYGGTIQLESDIGKGATFRFTWKDNRQFSIDNCQSQGDIHGRPRIQYLACGR